MPRYKLLVEYDGTGLVGWQSQPGAYSVQGLLEEALYAFCQEQAFIQCAGRTDAGVHARGQVAHVDLTKSYDSYRLMQGINFHLRHRSDPYVANITVLDAEEVSDEFHARFGAKMRHYEYHIINRRSFLALDQHRAWQVPVSLDGGAMQQAAQLLIGKHDFSSFRDSDCQAASPEKSLESFTLEQSGERQIWRLSARSFLHHQVRIMMGTLVQIGMGKWPIDIIPAIFAAKDRAKAGPTAPACGLYFMKVEYE